MAIARALVRKPTVMLPRSSIAAQPHALWENEISKVLLLDEATSALDSESEVTMA